MKFGVVVPLLLLAASPALAMTQEGCGGECGSCHKLTVKEANELVKGLGGKVVQVRVPAVRGLWELDIEKEGKKAIAYLDYGKKHLVPGPIFSLATRQPIAGGTTQQAPPLTRIDPARIPLTNSLVMGNPKGKKRLIVFTDPECPFCTKLHGELTKLVAQDPEVKVYVKLFPLKIHPKAYDKARAILQNGSLAMLEDSLAGRQLPEPGPPAAGNGVDETLKLGQTLGINATPTLIFPDGRVHAGSMEVAAIKQQLAGKKAKKK
jgi:thiol:disulfide interchange protein DsbC